MKGYKAFKKGLICDPTGNNPFQFAENTVFETDEAANPCHSGFHFCKSPLDVLDYYPLIDEDGNMTEFAEVEALDDAVTDDSKKWCTKKLKVGARLSLGEFVKLSVDVTREIIRAEAKNKKKDDTLIKAGGNYSTLAGGDYSTLAGGYRSTLAGGYRSTLAGGNYSKLAGGYYSTLAGGYYSTLAGGNYSTLAGGYRSTLAGGDYSTLAGGDGSTLAGGDYSTLAGGDGSTLAGGKHSILVGDDGSRARGSLGSLIVLVAREWRNGEYVITDYKATLVDGETVKADTWYKLEGGELVEVSV